MEPEIVIYVTGGVVQSVHANCLVKVRVVDNDDMSADGVSREDRENALTAATVGMQEVL